MQKHFSLAAVVAAVIGVATLLVSCGKAPDDTAWRAYKQRFVQADGRVVDTGNKNVSHTEGQGYAMLFAVAHNDRETFDRIWSWTHQTLRRPDGLYSWRYTPGADNPIADPNNATDGELVICWALLRASEVWKRDQDRAAAADIATALRQVIVEEGDDAYLLPGVEGFAGEGKRVVNLSYYVFPALKAIGASTGDAVWSKVSKTGLRLIETAKFGEHKLPPDWLETSGDLRPADGFPPRFGYDAVRVPLYLIWGGEGTAPRLDAIRAFWGARNPTPAWIDLVNGETSPETQSSGMAAVANLTLGRNNAPPDLQTTDYYSSSLLMLTLLAERDRAK